MKDFMFRALAWIITLPVFIVAVLFAFFHPQPVDILLSPFHAAVPMPLYLPVLGGIIFGFVFGALMTWAANGRLRAKAREQKRKIAALEKQLSVSNENTYKYHNIVSNPRLLLERKP